MNQLGFERRSAIFSDDRRYRALLRIVWDESKPLCAFVGLNPSTADEFADDPTIRRCKGFAFDRGFGGMLMLNLFAFRATIPAVMFAADDPVGPWLDLGSQLAHLNPLVVVACWGVHGRHRDRAHQAAEQIGRHFTGKRFLCFGRNADGSPKHPLYLPKTAQLSPFLEPR